MEEDYFEHGTEDKRIWQGAFDGFNSLWFYFLLLLFLAIWFLFIFPV